MTGLVVDDEQRELEAYLRTDLGPFTEKVFYQLNAGRDFSPAWYLQAMAHYLRVVAIERQVNRLVINLPPRALKSTMVSVALPAFLLGLDPTLRIVVASYSQELANMLGRQTRAIMQSDWYRRLFPSTRLNPKRTVEHDFQTTRGGFRLATSTGGTLTGRGGDVIIVDDPLKADDAYSDARRKAMIEWTRTTLFSRLDNKSEGVIINVQQRLHEDDLSGYLFAAGGWLELILPAIAEEEQVIPIGGGRLYRRRPGEALDQLREPAEVLEQIRRDLGSAIFAAQYQQSPTPADGAVVKLSWFQRYDTIPPDGQIVLSLDTASKTAEHNDYSAYTLWTIVDRRFYLMHAWRERVDYPTLKRKIIKVAETMSVDALLIEDKVAGTGLIQDLREDAGGLPVIPYMPEMDKESRLRRHASRIEGGLVFLPRQGSDWLSTFEHEVRQFPGGKHDDQIDSMSQVLDHYTVQRVGEMIISSFRS